MPERAGRPAPAELAATRAAIAGGIAAGAFATEPPAVPAMLGGVRALRFGPPGAPRGTVLHFHGGAFRIGAPEIVSAYAAALAARCGVAVFCSAYRLAPEHPFPAGLNDGCAAYAALAADGPVILSGDSAGGGLAASVGTLAVAAAMPPAGLVLHSPWADLTLESPAYRTNAGTDPLFSSPAATQAVALYLQGHDPRDPLASPVLADLAGFPPCFISAGAGEVLVEDARRLAAKLPDATLCIIDGMEHVAVTRSLGLPGAADVFERAVAFLDGILAPPASPLP